MDLRQAVGQRLLVAFKGMDQPPVEIIRALRDFKPAGISLFRAFNIDNPGQLRALTSSLQRLAGENDLPLLLMGADQEGGQLMSLGHGTPLPGNMAIGATGSEGLARRAGEVLGNELAAVGVNVDYAPVVDVNANPMNPVVGVRSFGEDPRLVARLSAAMIEGIQSRGVAATAKHFPGHGDTSSDSHLGLPVVSNDLEHLRVVEFPPFRAAIQSGVKLVMSAHVGLPAIDGPDAPPATLSKYILTGLLRRELGFEGVIVTDALDMHAIRQGELLGVDAVRAADAGADLLLVTSSPQDQERVHASLTTAALDGSLSRSELMVSAKRVLALKKWLAGGRHQPDLSVIRCIEHRQVAEEIAEKSVTLVRDRIGVLPVRLTSSQRMAVIMPRPLDLTPADTSSYNSPKLAEALREFFPNVDEFIVPHTPLGEDIAELVARMKTYDLIVVGTLNAQQNAGQTALVLELQKVIPSMAVVALRLPYDLIAFPDAPVYLCTYSILEPSMRALAKVMFGDLRPSGRLPVSIPGLYPVYFNDEQEIWK